MTMDLLQALEVSDVAKASEALREKIRKDVAAWEIHLSLFPVVQRVMNPPFINPHLPKMYHICRELTPYLNEEEIPALIHLEVIEYARRPKLERLPKADLLTSPVSFKDIESAIRDRDWEKTTTLMATFCSRNGQPELARQLLLLGSGYLNHSLGHSVSCTAFILLEMMEHQDQDPWPALATLADYFCKGQFHTTPPLKKATPISSDEVFNDHLLRATSGRGIVNLHHTITLYAIERVRHLFNREEYHHMMGAWVVFMEDKKAEQVVLDGPGMKPIPDYTRFYELFSGLDVKPAVTPIAGMIVSEQGRRQLGRFLIKGLCEHYKGDYNPHYLTGLGSVLWVVDRYWNQVPVAINALFQYVDFLFTRLKSED